MRILLSFTIGLAALCATIALPVTTAPATAALIATVGAAGQVNTALTGYNFFVDTLDAATNGLPTVAFAGSSITGTTTSGFVNIGAANVYGGAGGTGQFGTVNGNDSTLQLSQSVNYFGLWGSALDGNNTVALYKDDTLLGSYALQSLLQGSPGFNNGYYGNPFGGGDANEMYAFFNFQSDTAFNRVQLIQYGGGGFEFDNLTVGTSSAISAPEPATWAMMALGLGLVGWRMRRRGGGFGGTVFGYP